MQSTVYELVVQPDVIQAGHVNNVKYLEFLEQARMPWYEAFSNLGFSSFMANLNASYKKESFLGDHLRIQTSVHHVGNTSFVLKQTITNQREAEVLEAEVTFVAVDKNTKEKIRVPDIMRVAVEPLWK
ncbi:thioesterase family protein [Brevibacillus centrosporus]|uniref:acyl-CoA thioesterase n=1 Tax=Brevibacillus centrosporus TaxID=54910 RepID=UPI002E22CB56|nr:thioesterase family protein [Brevibacillus centrosporus]